VSLRSRIFVVGAAAVAAVGSFLTVGAPASSAAGLPAAGLPAAGLPPARVGAAPTLVVGAHRLGPLAASTSLHIDVVLAPRSPAALSLYAAEVSTPGSILYRRYLAPGRFAQAFGPTRASVRAVESYLRSAGLRYGAISGNHLSIPVRSTAGALERAFALHFDRVQLPSGRVAYANSTAPRFSGRAAAAVQAVIGLDSLNLPHRVSLVRLGTHYPMSPLPHVVTGGPQPCAAAVSAGPANDAFTADQLASAYRFSSLYGAGDEGSGVSVALYELEPNLTTDISAYQSCYGTSASVSYTKVDGGAGSGAGAGEAALDIEDVIGLAPKASIAVYQGPNTNAGAYDTYNAIMSADTSKVISTSWGLCESSEGSSAASAEATLFAEAATQGQSIFAAAGDGGSEDCGTSALAVDDPASQPYVTGVGGTHITALGPSPTESVWNERAVGAGAGGGGVSTLWTMPSYQSGAPSSLNVVNAHSSGTQCKALAGSYCREVPDVTADADPYSGYVVYYKGAWSGIGGTSAAAPLWAAFTALTDASASCAGSAVGFANPTLYTVAGSSSYGSTFQDITSGNNDYAGTHSGLYPAGAGYDMASGLGSPDGAGLPAAWCSGGTKGNTVTVTNPGAKTSTVGTAISLQISATDSGAGTTLTYSASGLPAGLSISASGLITGTPTTPTTYSVTIRATDNTGASGSASFSWTVKSTGGCTPKQLLGNPGFETGTAAPWKSTAGVIMSNSGAGGGEVAHSGNWFAWLDGYGVPHSDALLQVVAVPAGCTKYAFSYYVHIDTSEATTAVPVDVLRVYVFSGTTLLATLATYSNLNSASGYHLASFNLAAEAGKTITLKFVGVEKDTYGGTTDFTIDDTAFNVS
jgi:kumamolisin